MRTASWLCLLSIALITLAGCGAGSLKQRLSGRWLGAPDFSGEVAKYREQMKKAIHDEEGEMVTGNLAEFTGKVASRIQLGIDLNLRSDGSALVTGKTGVFGLQGDQTGTWSVDDKQQPPVLTLKLGDKQFSGPVTWRDEDAFFFEYEAPLKATTNIMEDSGDLPEDAETKPATLLIRRRKYS